MCDMKDGFKALGKRSNRLTQGEEREKRHSIFSALVCHTNYRHKSLVKFLNMSSSDETILPISLSIHWVREREAFFLVSNCMPLHDSLSLSLLLSWYSE